MLFWQSYISESVFKANYFKRIVIQSISGLKVTMVPQTNITPSIVHPTLPPCTQTQFKGGKKKPIKNNKQSPLAPDVSLFITTTVAKY